MSSQARRSSSVTLYDPGTDLLTADYRPPPAPVCVKAVVRRPPMGEDEHGYGRVSLWVRMGSGQGKANFSNHGVDFERAHRFSRTRWSYDSRSARRPTRAEVRAYEEGNET